MSWVALADAPLGELGLLWSPRFPDRTDMIGSIGEYQDGARFGISASAHNVEFTHWHPLPAPPAAEHA